MKKVFLSIMLVLGLMMVPMTAAATTFTLNEDALLMLWDVYENPENDGTFLTSVTDDPLVYGATMTGDIGFMGTIFDPVAGNDYTPFAQIGIGANFWGSSSTGSGATTAQVIGAALETGSSNSLEGFDTFMLTLHNDDDDLWKVNIFMNTGYTDTYFNEPNNWYENGWTWVQPGSSVTLSIDLTGVVNLNHVTNIGLAVGSDMNQVDGYFPSNPEVFHVSASPVPEPATMLLLGSGLIGLAAVGRKKFFKK